MIYFEKSIQYESQVFINLETALDHLALKDIDVDLAIIPLDVNDLTDEDKLNDKATATLLICGFPGFVDVVSADKEDGSEVPCTSADPNPPAKKQRKERLKVA